MKSSHNEISVALYMACARCLCMLYRYVCYNYNRMLGRGRSRNFLNCGLAWLGLIHFARTKYGNIFFAYVQIRSVCAVCIAIDSPYEAIHWVLVHRVGNSCRWARWELIHSVAPHKINMSRRVSSYWPIQLHVLLFSCNCEFIGVLFILKRK